MATIQISKPRPFQVPEYDITNVLKIASSTKLDAFYSNLLQGTLETPADDFTYGLPPQTARKLHERLINGFNWQEWVNKIKSMGAHYIVCTTESPCRYLTKGFQVDVKGVEGDETSTVHFVHSPSENKDAIPLVLLHGWP